MRRQDRTSSRGRWSGRRSLSSASLQSPGSPSPRRIRSSEGVSSPTLRLSDDGRLGINVAIAKHLSGGCVQDLDSVERHYRHLSGSGNRRKPVLSSDPILRPSKSLEKIIVDPQNPSLEAAAAAKAPLSPVRQALGMGNRNLSLPGNLDQLDLSSLSLDSSDSKQQLSPTKEDGVKEYWTTFDSGGPSKRDDEEGGRPQSSSPGKPAGLVRQMSNVEFSGAALKGSSKSG